MRRLITFLLLPSVLCANTLSAELSSLPSIIPTPTRTQSQQPSNQPLSTSSFPSDAPTQSTSSVLSLPHFWDPISSVADHVLDEISEHLHVDLRKRQGGAPITAPAVPVTSPTQLSPITTYQAYNSVGAQVNVVYTQTFAPVPEQWPSPSAGTVGLGTIQGPIGVVHKSKRDALPQETATPGQVLRIKGREVTKS